MGGGKEGGAERVGGEGKGRGERRRGGCKSNKRARNWEGVGVGNR